MNVEQPLWIWVSCGVALIGWFVQEIRFFRLAFKTASVSKLVFRRTRLSRWVLRVPLLLTTLGIVAFGVALSKPYELAGQHNELRRGIDILVLLDVSGSMLIEDFKPNRLEAAKQTIEAFSQRLKNDRLGLIGYAGEAYMQYPLSFDHDLLSQFLPFIESGALKEGTAIGVALAYGVDRLKGAKSGRRSRILVLLTDGDNNAGSISPQQAAEMAVDEGIPIYSLALGQEGKVPFPVYSHGFFGRRQKQYQMVDSTINHSLLKVLSEQTGGQYYRVDEQRVLSNVFKDIQGIEKSKLPVIRPQQKRKYHDALFLWVAFVMFLVAFGFEKTKVRMVP